MPSPKLCKAGQQLREQIDDAFSDRNRNAPEGWLADARHAARVSDHNPDPVSKIVRAYDCNADLGSSKHEAHDLADQLRLLARTDKRISYIIFDGKIASWKRNYKWRKYTGINPHKTHIHISFTKLGDNDRSMFRIPLLTGEPINGKPKKSRSILGKKLSGSIPSDLSSGGLGLQSDSSKRCCCRCACDNSLAKS
jgi:hypothetical protein